MKGGINPCNGEWSYYHFRRTELSLVIVVAQKKESSSWWDDPAFIPFTSWPWHRGENCFAEIFLLLQLVYPSTAWNDVPRRKATSKRQDLQMKSETVQQRGFWKNSSLLQVGDCARDRRFPTLNGLTIAAGIQHMLSTWDSSHLIPRVGDSCGFPATTPCMSRVIALTTEQGMMYLGLGFQADGYG